MKKILYFIIVFLFTIIGITVRAEEVTLVKERIGDLYTYYYDSNFGRNRFLYLNKYLFGENYAYCIELGKYIYGNQYSYSTSFDSAGLSDEDLEYIKLVSYYGYDYPGHNTDEYYMAAQDLIWIRLSNIHVKWVENMNPNNIVEVNEEKETIKNLITNHYKLPSFAGKTINVISGKETIIIDENNVLSNYKTDSQMAKIDGNKLIIDGNIDTNEINFTKNINSNKVFLLYHNGASQKMISAGKVKDVKSKIKLNIINGSITIHKKDSVNGDKPSGEASLKGAKYVLYDKNSNNVGTFITGESEKIEHLPLGEYYIKEEKPSPGYLLDDNIYTVSITEDNLNNSLEVYEEVIKRKVDIFKTFASGSTGSLIPEENVSFEIYDKNNNLIDTITTDNSGYTSTTLPYGTYILKQITSPKGYEKISDQKLIINEYDSRPIYKLYSDAPIKSFLRIIKKDFDTKEIIKKSNVKFQIFDVKNNKYLSFDNTDIFELSEDGTYITKEELPSGIYQIHEVDEKMNGYLYNNEYIEFEIDENSNFIQDEENRKVLEVTFYNKKVLGNIELHKYGEDIIYENNSYKYKETLLEGVVFKVYAKTNIYDNEKLIYEMDNEVGEIITDANGYGRIDNLPLGDYYLKEVSSSKDNNVSEITYNVSLKYQDQYTPVVVENVDVYNYISKGKLIINKYETSNNAPIPHTLIEIRKDKETVIYKGYTDDNGKIIINDLKYGDYFLAEVESATGYKLLEENIPFTISKEETTLDIYNERLEVPNTSSYFSAFIIISTISLLFSLIVLIFFHRYKVLNVLCIIILLIGVTTATVSYYQIKKDKIKSTKAVEAFLENKIDGNYEEKYKYNAIIEIPSINLKRGILDVNNEYNKAKYNIELVKETENTIVLASHNGNSYNSFFGNLHNLELGDIINYYKDSKLYRYVYSDSYEIKKDGHADLYHKNEKNSIILITCKDGTDDAQVIHIGYLKEIQNY